MIEKIKADSITYCEENKHLFTEEEIQFFELAKQGKIHSSKFWRKKEEAVLTLTRQAFAENPEQGLNPVIASILSTLPEHTPTDKLELYLAATIKEWQKLQAAVAAV